MATTTEVGEKALSFSENQEGNPMLENLRNQRKAGKFCDVVLHVEGKKLPAHRSFLAASSPYFESILKNHRVTKEEINIGWRDSKSFEIMLDYMYSGDVLIDAENVHELLKLSNHFLIAKLKGYCESYLDRFLNTDNCLAVRDVAEKYSLAALNETVTTFISNNIGEILDKSALSELSAKKFELFITDPATGCDTVPLQVLLNAIAGWAKKDISKRTLDFQKLLDVINWKDNDPQDIFAHIEAETLYQESKVCLFLILRTLVTNDVEVGKYAEDYEELRTDFEESGMLSQMEQDAEDNESAAVALTETSGRHSPILIEPFDDTPVARKSRAKPKSAKATPTRRTTRSKVTEPEDPVEEDDYDSTPRTRKRAVKPKFSSSEWVTDEPPAKSRKSDSAVKIKKAPDDDSVEGDGNEEEEESATQITFEQEEDEVEDADEDFENDDLEGIDSKPGRTRTTRIKPTFATLAQWREGVKCPHCIYIGHSATRLEQHLARVHEEDQTYKCRMCAFQCKWNREYYKHMKDHFGGPPYKCEDCDYTCDRIQFILSHRMRHTDERPFSCELCTFKSRTKGNLIVHMRIHTGEKPYRCQHCGRCFAMKNTLDQHLATHRDDRPFLCDTCGFTTKYQSHLLSHKRIHTGNVFYCEQEGCQYYSPRRSQLAAHMRSHLCIRSHICSTCGRGFIEKSHLIRHERIHLDEKPFKCTTCDYGSTRRDKLKEHVLKHHSAEGTPKTPYKPRKPRSSRSTAAMNTISAEELHTIIGNGSPQEIQISQASQMSEHELASANLVYEYTTAGDQLTIGPARVVIQSMGEFGDGQAVLVEQKEEGDEADETQQVVIYGGEEGQQSTTVKSTRSTRQDANGLNAFMAFV